MPKQKKKNTKKAKTAVDVSSAAKGKVGKGIEEFDPTIEAEDMLEMLILHNACAPSHCP